MATAARPGIDPLELERYRPQLLKFAILQLRDPTSAEDAVQETLLAAIQSGGNFAGQSSVSTWLVGILKHKVIDTIRRRSRERPLELDSDEVSLEDLGALFQDDGHLRDQPADWGDPESALTQRKFFEVLERCMRELPKNTARVFTMREVTGLECDEICKELGITSSNCWVLLYRARMRLRTCLEQRWFGTGAKR
jgi:RNA polymerase sigma-70 factor (ECF subfamily)